MTNIKTLLIANRGEIAVRVIKTARELGIRTVAVFAEADRHAPHVRLADTAVYLGEGPVAKTYLDQLKILGAMQKSGADAVHPGYGFLSENAEFAQSVIESGYRWVGPPVTAMNAMASKARAKQTLEPKGVPMIPGYHGDAQDDATLMAEAERIGFPLLVKASAGGGGKGMKVVERLSDVQDALDSARREAENSFGDGHLLLEKFLVKPRHIEVQIMADQHGNVVSLFERDCSVQRRHQKVLEEAPAPELPASTKQAMWEAAETCAREIGYEGAGTVEFILSSDGSFYFLEMNTRLQVEHPVTELITGLDLVACQLKVASGEVLAIQRPERPIGHSIEVRLYAEDPAQEFLPMVGRLEHIQFPSGAGIRIDTGVEGSANVSSFYDPMLAKIIVHADNRKAAIAKLSQALADTRCFGLTTNLEFLRHLVRRAEVADMSVHTRWLDETPEVVEQTKLQSIKGWAALAATLYRQEQAPEHEATSPWMRHAGWRMTGQQQWGYALAEDETVGVIKLGEQYELVLPEGVVNVDRASFEMSAKNTGRMFAEVDGMTIEWDCFITDERVFLDNGDRQAHIEWWQADKAHDHDLEASGRQLAVLPGVVTEVYKKPGDAVEVGDKLISFEAMKMETTLLAEVSGTLTDCSWQVGDQISEGDLLFHVTEADA